MGGDYATFLAVQECRRLVDEGERLPDAAAHVAAQYGLHAMHVAQQAGRALEACRIARQELRGELGNG